MSDIEWYGISLNKGEMHRCVKQTFCSAFGDNLRLYDIGGFMQNSVSKYNCRYFLITSKQFHQNPLKIGKLYAPDSYDTNNSTAIKLDSILNTLQRYLLAHDLLKV